MIKVQTLLSKLVMRPFLVSGVVLIGFFTGCEWTPAGPDELSIEELTPVLESLVLSDETISVDGLGDSDFQEDEYYEVGNIGRVSSYLAKILPDTLWPSKEMGVRWQRRISERNSYFRLDSVAVDTAYGTISRILTGSFHLVVWARNDSGEKVILDSLNKPLEIGSARRILFVRGDNTADSSLGWRIAGRTAVLGTAGEKVSLSSIAFVETDGTTLNVQRGAVLSTFFRWNELPRFPSLDTLQCYAQVENHGSEFPLYFGERVIVRRVGRVDQARFTNRARLSDNGRDLDQLALDNTFSGSFIINQLPHKYRVFHIFVEVTDLASFLVPAEGYHCEFIGFPYLVVD
ncbi:hypothetical protein ACFL4K_03585 [Candidatus Neomarinimicrobiota bacterium]